MYMLPTINKSMCCELLKSFSSKLKINQLSRDFRKFKKKFFLLII